jgi:hypothetical protein
MGRESSRRAGEPGGTLALPYHPGSKNTTLCKETRN